MFNKVNEADVLRSINYMLDAGISMHDTLQEILYTISNRKVVRKLEIIDDLMVNSGYKLVDAFEAAGFMEQYMPIIKTGEKTGNITKVIKELIEVIDKLEKIKKKVRSMVVYPVVLMVMSVLMGFGISFLLGKVLTALPKKDIEGTIAYSVAVVIVNYRWIIFPMYGVFLAGLLSLVVKYASRLPIINKIYNSITTGQTFKMFALSIKSGLTPKEAIELTAGILNEQKWKRAFALLATELKETNIYLLIDELSDFVPSSDLLIVKAGIRAGKLYEGFEYVGERKIEDSYALLESISPLVQMIAFMFVAVQIIGVMSPIYFLLFGFADKF